MGEIPNSTRHLGDHTRILPSDVRKEEFQANAPGHLVSIGEDEYSFVPDDLPPSLASSWRLLNLNERANRALGELVGQARLVANETLVVGPLLTREAVDSNRIEGTYTLVEDVLLQRATGPARDEERAASNTEVLRYMETLDAATAMIRDSQPVSAFLLRTMHENLLRGTRGEQKSPGRFRTRLVGIGREGQDAKTAAFVPPPPERVPAAIDNLVTFLEGEPEYGHLIAMAIAHYQFETIHPFEDGNGRAGSLADPRLPARAGRY